jgi:two-component system, cell cycle response regulator
VRRAATLYTKAARRTPMDSAHPRPIIVVEDDPATRKLLERQLAAAGYAVQAFADGRSAMAPITGLGSGIVLADWSMPEMDGLELCRGVRELEGMGAFGPIYFILLTAHDSKEQTIAGLEAGANDYLTKPYHLGELLARIHVGARMLRLQEELLQRTLEYHKANAQLAVLSNKLEEQANTDALTGLANRRFLFQRVNELWELTARHGQALSCIMCDVDKFKRINDTHGHDAGDQVLRGLAATLRSFIKRRDLCGRIGGEEFIVLCPGATGDEAARIAERLRTHVAALITQCQGVDIRATVSCGVATRTPDVHGPDELIHRADSMLYAAKEHGRNQVWVLGSDGTPQPATEIAAAEVT